jgi:hypothetical protein
LQEHRDGETKAPENPYGDDDHPGREHDDVD